MNYKVKVLRLLIFILCFSSNSLFAQTSSEWLQRPTFHISGFLDLYYVIDFNKPTGEQRQPFLYNHNRHDEINVNLGFIKLGMQHSKYRGNLALHSGTYSVDNYAAEPGVLKNLFEANIGMSLNKKNKLWLDAGVFASHIGFESAISIDNWTLTRSLLAENTPYYLSGLKLTSNPNEHWELAALIVNGWQRIQRLQGNSIPSVGTQVKYAPTQRVTINWSSFIGTDDPDSTRRMRYFNNFYGQFTLTEKLGLIAGFDIGMQQRSKHSSSYDYWLSPIIIGQVHINKSWKTAIRAEYYQDQSGIIIRSATSNGFTTTGLSVNLDYSPTKNILCRMEGRWLNSKDQLFERESSYTSSNFILAASFAVWFSKDLKK